MAAAVLIFRTRRVLSRIVEDEERTDGPVRKVVGENIQRVRSLRQMTVRDLAARLKELGLPLSASGVSEVEHASRKLGIDELLIIAIALNTSVIDLISPISEPDTTAAINLQVAEGIEPVHPQELQRWMRGDGPPWDATQAEQNAFNAATSQLRKDLRWLRSHPALNAITTLDELAFDAVAYKEHMITISPPSAYADALRQQLARVVSYVNLLADDVEHRDDKKVQGRDGG
jgi:transcriptional regulator with XRE-family HTH domain